MGIWKGIVVCVSACLALGVLLWGFIDSGQILALTSYSFRSITLPRVYLSRTLANHSAAEVDGHVTPNRTKLVIDWTGFFGSSLAAAFHPGLCTGENRCTFTQDKSRIEEADAVLFHNRDLSWNKIPKIRYQFQRYIFFLMESPHHSGASLSSAKNFFNWTMTYRLDSDIRQGYGSFEKRVLGAREAALEMDRCLQMARNKTKLAAWFVSNCHTPSKREVYVTKLQEYIPVDVFGACGSHTCPRSKSDACNQMLATDYKFYISFENSVCKDYVTEKFFKMRHYVVPVVLRADDNARLAPENSFIAADNFASPKELANYLQFLDRNLTEYMKYFEWRKRAVIGGSMSQNFCNLCAKLYADENVTSTYSDIEKWWMKDARCEANFAAALAGEA